MGQREKAVTSWWVYLVRSYANALRSCLCQLLNVDDGEGVPVPAEQSVHTGAISGSNWSGAHTEEESGGQLGHADRADKIKDAERKRFMKGIKSVKPTAWIPQLSFLTHQYAIA